MCALYQHFAHFSSPVTSCFQTSPLNNDQCAEAIMNPATMTVTNPWKILVDQGFKPTAPFLKSSTIPTPLPGLRQCSHEMSNNRNGQKRGPIL